MAFTIVTTNTTIQHFGNNSFPNSVEFGLRFSFNAPEDKKKRGRELFPERLCAAVCLDNGKSPNK
jgi:hypothetical protein